MSAILMSGIVYGTQSVIYSKHNLSVTGTGLIKATIEQPVCRFCHTPHREGQAPATLAGKPQVSLYYL